MKLIYIIVIAIIGIAVFFIWRRHTEESRGENIDKYINDVEGQAMLEDEMKRLELEGDVVPFTAYRDPELYEQYMNLPFKVYYYNEDRLNEESKQLLFGTGTVPIYERQSAFKYPRDYTAPVAVSQYQHDVDPPNRYDYLSWLDTAYV